MDRSRARCWPPGLLPTIPPHLPNPGSCIGGPWLLDFNSFRLFNWRHSPDSIFSPGEYPYNGRWPHPSYLLMWISPGDLSLLSGSHTWGKGVPFPLLPHVPGIHSLCSICVFFDSANLDSAARERWCAKWILTRDRVTLEQARQCASFQCVDHSRPLMGSNPCPPPSFC